MKTLTNVTLSALMLAIFACNQPNSNQSESEGSTDSEVIDGHNANNALDWPGSYFGTLPCASCPGINTMITLNSDQSFEKTTEYLEEDDTPETITGKFTWEADQTRILLDDNFYKVGENELYMLDADGREITGDMAQLYVLKKTELESEPDFNEGSYLQSYVGDDGKNYNVIFNTNSEPPTATIETDGLTRTLKQTEVWAKGAVYQEEGIRLSADGDEAVLTIGGKKIDLKIRD